MKAVLARLGKVLASRKNQTAIVTLLTVAAAKYKLDVSTETLYLITSLGVAIILGIAVEDNGRHIADGPNHK